MLLNRWPLADRALAYGLIEAYDEPHRGYHNTEHLTEVFDRLDELALAGAQFDPLPVALAVWWHDAVYDDQPMLEVRSAERARAQLGGSGVGPAVINEVERLILLTITHSAQEDDVNGSALCDADLAILAAAPPRYARYVDGVRAEYAHFDDRLFARGRADVLRRLLARPSLFHTVAGHRLWEESARANLGLELAALDASLREPILREPSLREPS